MLVAAFDSELVDNGKLVKNFYSQVFAVAEILVGGVVIGQCV